MFKFSKIKIKTLIIIYLLSFFILSNISYAEITANGPENFLNSPITDYTTAELILINIVRWVYTIFFIIAILFILLAAYNFVVSKGETEGVDKAKKQLEYAVIAIVIALIASGISLILRNFLYSRGFF